MALVNASVVGWAFHMTTEEFEIDKHFARTRTSETSHAASDILKKPDLERASTCGLETGTSKGHGETVSPANNQSNFR